LSPGRRSGFEGDAGVRIGETIMSEIADKLPYFVRGFFPNIVMKAVDVL
jgi:hypothetical protein